jgi:DNA-directed RNA polymerase subunit alpha
MAKKNMNGIEEKEAIHQCLVCQPLRQIQSANGRWYGRFIIGPLDSVDALTYATTLRRLLMSLRGPCITLAAVRYLNHEFATMLGLRESTTDFVQRLSEVVIGYQRTNQNVTHGIFEVSFQGPGVFTADCLPVPPPFKIVNPQHVLATLTTNTKLEMVLCIENAARMKIREKPPLPILAVPYRNQVVTQVTSHHLALDQDNRVALVMEIWTNGGLSPSTALKRSARIASHFFKFY